MKLIGVMGNSGSGKTTFTEYLGTKSTVGVIHVDKLTGEVKKKYFWAFLQGKDKNTTENTKNNPKLRPGAKAIFYKNKIMFNLLMALRNRLIGKELKNKTQMSSILWEDDDILPSANAIHQHIQDQLIEAGHTMINDQKGNFRFYTSETSSIGGDIKATITSTGSQEWKVVLDLDKETVHT